MIEERLDAFEQAVRKRERWIINNAPRDGGGEREFKELRLPHDLDVLAKRALVVQCLRLGDK